MAYAIAIRSDGMKRYVCDWIVEVADADKTICEQLRLASYPVGPSPAPEPEVALDLRDIFSFSARGTLTRPEQGCIESSTTAPTIEGPPHLMGRHAAREHIMLNAIPRDLATWAINETRHGSGWFRPINLLAEGGPGKVEVPIPAAGVPGGAVGHIQAIIVAYDAAEGGLPVDMRGYLDAQTYVNEMERIKAFNTWGPSVLVWARQV